MKQRLEILIPVGAIALAIALAQPWSHLQTLRQLWHQRQLRMAVENMDAQSTILPPIVQLGSIQGQVVHDANRNGQADQQKTVIYTETFDGAIAVAAELENSQGSESQENVVKAVWSNVQTIEVPTHSNTLGRDQILGLFGGLKDGEQGHVTLTLDQLPPHQSVELAVEVWIVDSWDGNIEASFAPDLWQVCQGSERVLLRTAFSNIDSRVNSQSYPLAYPEGQFSPRTNATATYRLRQSGYGDSIHHIRQTFAHSEGKLALDFSGQGKTSLADNESWGLNNLRLTLRSGEEGLSNIIVFLDQNHNGVRDADERFTQTDGDGNYQFQGLVPGDYRVQIEEKVDGEETNGEKLNITTSYQDIQVWRKEKGKTVNFLGSP